MTNQSGPDDDPDQRRLDDLGRRIEAVREQQPEAKPAQPSSAGAAYRLASELIAGLLVGVLMGWGFDSLFGTRPWGLMVFLILGLTAAMINVIRSAQKMNAAAASEAKEREK